MPVFKKKGRVFYEGENQYRQRTGKYNYYSLHAEMNALFQNIKGKRKNKFNPKIKLAYRSRTIYVVRLLNSKEGLPKSQRYWLGNSKPCCHCQKYLKKFNITKIKYTDIIDGKNVLCELRLN